MDYIQLSHGRSLNVLGAGMDVDVLLKYASMKGNGTIKYYMALFHTLAHAKFHRLRITVDDGKLSIVVINELPKNKILGAALRFLKGTHVKLDAAEVLEGKKVLVEILDDSQFEADGEILPPMPQLEAQIVSNQLKIFR